MMRILRILAPVALLCVSVVAVELGSRSADRFLVAHHDNLDGAKPLAEAVTARIEVR